MDDVFKHYSDTIHTVLTDTGKKFMYRFCRVKTQSSAQHLVDRACRESRIEHRLIRAYTHKTNGLVEQFKSRIAEILKNVASLRMTV